MMKPIRKSMLLLLLTPLFAFAADDDSSLPFEPVHAADQAVITSRSLQEEFDQFRAIIEWEKARTQLAIVQARYDHAKIEFENAKALRDSHTITETKYAEAYIAFREVEDSIIRLPMEIVKAKMTAQFHMYRVLEEGNPNAPDHRRDLAQVMSDGIQLEIKTQNSSLELAKASSDLAQKFFEAGQDLEKKSSLSKQDLAKRKVGARNAALQVTEIEKLIEVAGLALKSFQDSLAKLSR